MEAGDRLAEASPLPRELAIDAYSHSRMCSRSMLPGSAILATFCGSPLRNGTRTCEELHEEFEAAGKAVSAVPTVTEIGTVLSSGEWRQDIDGSSRLAAEVSAHCC